MVCETNTLLYCCFIFDFDFFFFFRIKHQVAMVRSVICEDQGGGEISAKPPFTVDCSLKIAVGTPTIQNCTDNLRVT